MKHNGWVLVDKIAGITSMQTVKDIAHQLSKLYNVRVRDLKVGHGGTLDPFATGLLPIAFGEATKLLQLFMNVSKAYVFTMVFGEKRDTGDVTGKIIDTDTDYSTKLHALETVIANHAFFTKQVPHKMSAIKVNGMRAYDLFRKGVEYSLEARHVDIYDLRLLETYENNNAVTLYVKCGKGLYVRSLCEDIAAALGTVAYVSKLDRVEYGSLGIRGYGAIQIDSDIHLKQQPLDILECKNWFPYIEVNACEAEKLKHGTTVVLDIGVQDGVYMMVHERQIICIANVSNAIATVLRGLVSDIC